MADLFERVQLSGEQMKHVDFDQLRLLNGSLDVDNLVLLR